MKDSRETGLFHLSLACWSISTPPSAALVGLSVRDWAKKRALGREVFPRIDLAENTLEVEPLKLSLRTYAAM